MRRYAYAALLSIAAVGALWAQPKVAVLDAVVPKAIDQSVVIPVTEKIMERLVVSGRFTVLDRANIEQVLKEKEFQVSGMVSDAEITEAGKYLGADFVVVSKVQKVSDTYFLSAKMIAVKTGVIANQTSAENEGKLSVLIKLAERVGDVLSGGTVLAPSAADPKNKTAEPAAPAPIVAPVRAPAKPVEDHVGLRVYLGFGGGAQEHTSGSFSAPTASTGGEIYALWGVFSGLCLVGGIGYMDGSGDNGPAVTSYNVGIGYAYPIGVLMPWAALKIGGTSSEWKYQALDAGAGTAILFDAGLDLRLGSFLLGVRYQYEAAHYENWDGYIFDGNTSSFWLMGGYRF